MSDKHDDYTMSDDADELHGDVSIFKRIQDFNNKVNNNKVLRVLFMVCDVITNALESIRGFIHKIAHVKPAYVILMIVTVLLIIEIAVLIMSNPTFFIDKLSRIFITMD